MILELALVALLAPILSDTRPVTAKAPEPIAQPAPLVLGGTELARAIKTDLEGLSGPGSVDVSVDHETLFSVRIAVPDIRAEISNPIYDRALALYREYPDFSFDFYLHLKPKSATKRP